METNKNSVSKPTRGFPQLQRRPKRAPKDKTRLQSSRFLLPSRASYSASAFFYLVLLALHLLRTTLLMFTQAESRTAKLNLPHHFVVSHLKTDLVMLSGCAMCSIYC